MQQRRRGAGAGGGGAASLHARLDAAKLRVQKDLAASAGGGFPGTPRQRRRRTRPDRTTPDRISPPPRRAPGAAAPRSPAATARPQAARSPAPVPSESRAAYVAAPVAVEPDTPPETVRYRELLLEQDAQSRQRSELLELLGREIGAAVDSEGGGTDDRLAHARALQEELAGQTERRQHLLGALQQVPQPDYPPGVVESQRSDVDEQQAEEAAPLLHAAVPPVPVERAEATPEVERLAAPQRQPAVIMSSSEDGDQLSGSDSSSNSCSGSDAGASGPEGRNASVQYRGQLTTRMRSLWGDLRQVVRSQRDYSSVLTMVCDATADFW
jgi:hypothetical protein